MARSGDSAKPCDCKARHIDGGFGAGQSEIDHFGARTLVRQYGFGHRRTGLRLPHLHGLDDGIADDDCPRPRTVGERPVAIAQAEIGGADEVAVLGQPHAADIGAMTVSGVKIRPVKGDLRQRQNPAQWRCVDDAKERFRSKHRQHHSGQDCRNGAARFSQHDQNR